MRRIGLTGGIGSGKSTVAAMLAEAGIPVVDADQLARAAVAPGTPGLEAVRARFGPGILDAGGALDRPALGRLVFADAAARRDLEAIVHPEVARLSQAAFAELEAEGHPAAVYDVPLLFETGREGEFDMTVVVSAPPAEQRARIQARDGTDAEAAQARIDAQMPLAEKVRRADLVIDNGGSLQETRRQVDELIENLKGRA